MDVWLTESSPLVFFPEQVVKEKERKEKLTMKRERVRDLCAIYQPATMTAHVLCGCDGLTLLFWCSYLLQKAKKDSTVVVKKVSNKVLRRMKIRKQEQEEKGEVVAAKPEKMDTKE